MHASMRNLAVVVLMISSAWWANSVNATSFDPLPRDEEPATMTMVPGDAVHLFHGAREASSSLKVGDLLGVSRKFRDGMIRVVGTIRVTAIVGKFCLRGEVVEGKILPHDLAEKGMVFCLVIPEALCRK